MITFSTSTSYLHITAVHTNRALPSFSAIFQYYPFKSLKSIMFYKSLKSGNSLKPLIFARPKVEND